MTSPPPKPIETIRIIQPASTEQEILRTVDPEATPAEIEAGMTGCVVHLCGCK